MASALPEELQAAIDVKFSERYFGLSLAGVGQLRSDLRKVFWHPTPPCKHPTMHRCIKAIRTAAQGYDDVMEGIRCIACRICDPRRDTQRTRLEAEGYAACTKVYGDAFMYATEWMPFNDTRRSVDLMIVSTHPPFMTCAVQFDGSHHKSKCGEDFAFDMRLLDSNMCTHTIRLAAEDINTWDVVLRSAKSAAGGAFTSPSLATHLVLARQLRGAAEPDQRASST